MIKEIQKEVQEITKWIKNYVEEARADGVVIGNSGGKDCATVIALAQKALGSDKVLTVSIPCNSIKADMEDAKLIAEAFDVPLIKVDISETYQALEKHIDKVIMPKEVARKRSKNQYQAKTKNDHLILHCTKPKLFSDGNRKQVRSSRRIYYKVGR